MNVQPPEPINGQVYGPPNKWAAGLWQRLFEAGLTPASEPPSSTLDTPWYIHLMLGGAGWMAALFLLGFVTLILASLVENPVAAITVGTALMAACWYLQKRFPDNVFISQFGLALSFTGQGLFIFGLFDSLELEFEDLLGWLLIGLLQAALAWVMPSVFHRTCSAFAAAGALAVLLFHAGAVALAAPLLLGLSAFLWLRHWYWPGQVSRCRAIAWGLSIAVAGLSCFNLGLAELTRFSESREDMIHLPPWLSECLIGLVLIIVVISLLRRYGQPLAGLKGSLILACSVLLALVSIKAPGISIGICILLLGIANGSRLLCGLGIIALLGYVSFYYYQLDLSLMAKSGWLALNGVVLLLSRWLVGRIMGQHPDKLPGGPDSRTPRASEVHHA